MSLLALRDAAGAGEDRFDWFCEMVSHAVMPVALSARHAGDFRATVTDLDLGVVRLSAVACSPVFSRRTATHIRRGDPEHVQLGLVTRGEVRISQRGNESLIAGGIVLTDTSRPSEGACTQGQIETLVMQIPRQALGLSPDRVDRLLARNLATDAGTGAILADFLKTLLTRGPQCRPEELSRMGSVALDLATAFLARQLGDPGAAPAEARAGDAAAGLPLHREQPRRPGPDSRGDRRSAQHVRSRSPPPVRRPAPDPLGTYPPEPAGARPHRPRTPGTERAARSDDRRSLGLLQRDRVQPGVPRSLRDHPHGTPCALPGRPAARR